jgi:isopropylmalate/homocitrate/citramalate synthase
MSEQSVCMSPTPLLPSREVISYPGVQVSGINLLPDRTWPEKRIPRAPRWLSTDMREGNQGAMSTGYKLKVFELLSRIGCKEIETGCPAASQDHFNFVRQLIDEDRIRPDIRISVLTPARADLINRTIASLNGAARAIVHLCNAGSPFPGQAFPAGDGAAGARIVAGVADLMRVIGPRSPSCALAVEYSLGTFADMEVHAAGEQLHAALDVCAQVADFWQPEPGRELIVNFSADIRRTAPGIFADQVEWLDRHLSGLPYTCLSIHPRNDADAGVAAAELALLAGAQRVEGCLLAHGKQTQDISLARLGTNLLSHGVDPEIDLAGLDGKSGPGATLPDHGGDAQATVAAEIGRIMCAEYGFELPSGLRAEFAEMVQAWADASGSEVSPGQMRDLFELEYMVREPASALLMRCSARCAGLSPADPWIALFKIRQSIRTAEDNPALVVNGALAAMGLDVTILRRQFQILENSGLTAVYVHCVAGARAWGVGVGSDLTTASLKAVLSAVNRADAKRSGKLVSMLPGR